MATINGLKKIFKSAILLIGVIREIRGCLILLLFRPLCAFASLRLCVKSSSPRELTRQGQFARALHEKFHQKKPLIPENSTFFQEQN
jgi:hypothetical protein